MVCLVSDKIIKQICFSSLDKTDSSKHLQVYSGKVILFFGNSSQKVILGIADEPENIKKIVQIKSAAR